MKYIVASIFDRFWWILATKLGVMCLQDAQRWPNLAHRTAQEPPRGAQDGSRTAQELPKKRPGTCQNVPWSQGMPRSRPDSLQTSNLDNFGHEFGTYLLDF